MDLTVNTPKRPTPVGRRFKDTHSATGKLLERIYQYYWNEYTSSIFEKVQFTHDLLTVIYQLSLYLWKGLLTLT